MLYTYAFSTALVRETHLNIVLCTLECDVHMYGVCGVSITGDKWLINYGGTER